MASRGVEPEVVDLGFGWNVFMDLDEGVTVYRVGVGDEPGGVYFDCERHGLTGCRHLSAVQRHVEQET